MPPNKAAIDSTEATEADLKRGALLANSGLTSRIRPPLKRTGKTLSWNACSWTHEAIKTQSEQVHKEKARRCSWSATTVAIAIRTPAQTAEPEGGRKSHTVTTFVVNIKIDLRMVITPRDLNSQIQVVPPPVAYQHQCTLVLIPSVHGHNPGG